MLISDPSNEAGDQDLATDVPEKLEASFNASVTSAAATKRMYAESVGRRSRKSSYSMFPASASLDNVQEGKMLLNSVRRNSLALPLNPNVIATSENGALFQVVNSKPQHTFEPEHFKSVSVDNLENTPIEIAAAAAAAPGVKRKRRGMEWQYDKLFKTG
jgi:hypothetical protein